MATLLQKLERVPPFMCRLLARDGRRGLSHNDIAERSGLERTTVRNLSFSTSWRGYTIDTIVAFTTACGVNHLAAEKQLDYAKRRLLPHTERATGAQRQMYDRLKQLLVEFARQRQNERHV